MPENIVTNADDVEVVIESELDVQNDDRISTELVRVTANEFTITADQTIGSVGSIGQNVPKGLTKGDLEYSYDFTIDGDAPRVHDITSDNRGDSLPFSMTARKPSEGGEGFEWEHTLLTCLADTDEISGTTGEAMQTSVEGMAALMDRDLGL